MTTTLTTSINDDATLFQRAHLKAKRKYADIIQTLCRNLLRALLWTFIAYIAGILYSALFSLAGSKFTRNVLNYSDNDFHDTDLFNANLLGALSCYPIISFILASNGEKLFKPKITERSEIDYLDSLACVNNAKNLRLFFGIFACLNMPVVLIGAAIAGHYGSARRTNFILLTSFIGPLLYLIPLAVFSCMKQLCILSLTFSEMRIEARERQEHQPCAHADIEKRAIPEVVVSTTTSKPSETERRFSRSFINRRPDVVALPVSDNVVCASTSIP